MNKFLSHTVIRSKSHAASSLKAGHGLVVVMWIGRLKPSTRETGRHLQVSCIRPSAAPPATGHTIPIILPARTNCKLGKTCAALSARFAHELPAVAIPAETLLPVRKITPRAAPHAAGLEPAREVADGVRQAR